jgi:hypothetical protein
MVDEKVENKGTNFKWRFFKLILFSAADGSACLTGRRSFLGIQTPVFLQKALTDGPYVELEKGDQMIEKNPTLEGEIDKIRERDGELLSGGRTLIALYHEDLSYRPNVNIPQMRYVSVTTYRVRPGHNSEFVALRKTTNAAHEKANIDEHWAIYQVVTGAASGT